MMSNSKNDLLKIIVMDVLWIMEDYFKFKCRYSVQLARKFPV
jgi:hypothetical protein